jgi:trigger factor
MLLLFSAHHHEPQKNTKQFDYFSKELAGKPAVFKVKVNEIKTKEYPEMDDEFAKDVSEFDTIAELNADNEKKALERKEKIKSTINSLLKKNTEEAPVEEAPVEEVAEETEEQSSSDEE